MTRIAVIVTTYNRPDALAAVLDGYLAQTDRGFELIVADDGSTADTAAVIDAHRARARHPVRHVWQEDRGFAAAAIRNRALAATDAGYVIFTDGDCIPRPDFVAQHRRLAEPGWFLSGNRVLLGPRLTRIVLEQRLPVHEWHRRRWLGQRLTGGVNRLLPLIALPDGGFRKRGAARWQGAKTCNLSVWRADLERIDGFDEAYQGWGLEDSDLAIRLIHAGVRHKSARFGAAVLHLWHPENDRSRLAANRRRLDALLASRRIDATVGLSRHRAGGG